MNPSISWMKSLEAKVFGFLHSSFFPDLRCQAQGDGWLFEQGKAS
jgi:hypothetical protein